MRRRWQRELEENMARAIIELVEASSVTSISAETMELAAPQPCVSVWLPDPYKARSQKNDYRVTFYSGSYEDLALAVHRSAMRPEGRTLPEVRFEGHVDHLSAYHLRTIKNYRQDFDTFIRVIWECTVLYLAYEVGGYTTPDAACNLTYHVLKLSDRAAIKGDRRLHAWLDEKTYFTIALSTAEYEEVLRHNEGVRGNEALPPEDFLDLEPYWGAKIVPGLVNRWLEESAKPSMEARTFLQIW